MSSRLVQAVSDALAATEPIESVGHAITVVADDDTVTLNGIVRTEIHRHLAASVAAAVPGVRRVENRLVSDTSLATQVGTSVGRDRQLARLPFVVSSHLGTVTFSGPEPADDLARRLQSAALAVPLVESVSFASPPPP